MRRYAMWHVPHWVALNCTSFDYGGRWPFTEHNQQHTIEHLLIFFLGGRWPFSKHYQQLSIEHQMEFDDQIC